MVADLEVILEIQKIDMELIRLALIRKERQDERTHIESLRKNLKDQLDEKKMLLEDLTHKIMSHENEINTLQAKMQELDKKQSEVKKVDAFNALTHEITAVERERVSKSKIASDLIDQQALHKETVEKLEKSLEELEESSASVEEEISNNVAMIEEEATKLKEKRGALTAKADKKMLDIYMRLLKNKRDAVVVPLDDRVCSGCNIALTAQHENLVRRGERLVFCEHCSRVHYWIDNAKATAVFSTKKRRRRSTARR